VATASVGEARGLVRGGVDEFRVEVTEGVTFMHTTMSRYSRPLMS
jgi:hypothetical protein